MKPMLRFDFSSILSKKNWVANKTLMIKMRDNVCSLRIMAIIIMQSPYYKCTPTGYVLTYRHPPENVDLTRTLPVFRVVHEFMEPPPQIVHEKPDEVLYKTEVEPHYLSFSTSKQESGRKEENFRAQRSLRLIEKDEIKSIITVDELSLPLGSNNEKYMSLQNLNARQEEFRSRGCRRYKMPEYKPESVTAVESATPSTSRRQILFLELQKERALRENLEKSYQRLLQEIDQQKSVLSPQNFTIELRSSEVFNQKRYPNTDRTSLGSPKIVPAKQGKQKRRRSCCSFKDISHSQASQQNQKIDDYPVQEQKLLKRQRQVSVRNQIEEQVGVLNNRIDEMEVLLMRHELLVQKQSHQQKLLQLQNKRLREEIENQKLKSGLIQSREIKMGLSMKENLHYIFTIVIVFLSLAMIAKSKNG